MGTKQSQNLAKNHYHSSNSEMPKAWPGIRTEVSSLSASQTVCGMPGISFFYSVHFFVSPPIMLIWTSWWSGKAIHTDQSICFQLKTTICYSADKHVLLWKGELSWHLMLLSICNLQIWKYFIKWVQPIYVFISQSTAMDRIECWICLYYSLVWDERHWCISFVCIHTHLHIKAFCPPFPL